MQLQETLGVCNQFLPVVERGLSLLFQTEEKALVIILVAGQWHLLTGANRKCGVEEWLHVSPFEIYPISKKNTVMQFTVCELR